MSLAMGTASDADMGSHGGIDIALSRSWLLVRGADADRFLPASLSGADQIILDIEDAVDPAGKPDARETVASWLESGGSGWVRVNDATSPWWQDDLERLRFVPGLRGVMLAKAETAEQVSDTYALLGLPIVALVESALGVENATEIARAHGTARLAFGSGDYRRDTGTSADDIAMAYPRSRLVVSSRVANLPGPIDGPTVTGDHEHLRDKTGLGMSLGMTGKLILDPTHATTVNGALSPSAVDIEWARHFLDDFAARGSQVRDGSDPPRLRLAAQILDVASRLGLVSPHRG